MGRYEYWNINIYGKKHIWEDKHMGKQKYGKIKIKSVQDFSIT